jgi:ribosomal protein S18 acetylase RimI-like enzyme
MTEEFLIRESTDADVEFFQWVEEQTTWENLPPDVARIMEREQLRERLLQTHALLLSSPGHVCFIAQRGSERAGLLWFGPRYNFITGEDEGWIYNVTVLPSYRRLGIAKKLLRHAENYARQQGFLAVGLCVGTHNQDARRLYGNLNYQENNLLLRKPLARNAQSISEHATGQTK